MTDTQSSQPASQPTENFEVLALRHALEEAAVAVNRSETLLSSARSDLQNEKRNSAKLRVDLESEKIRTAALKAQVEQARLAELVLGEPATPGVEDPQTDEVSVLKKEQTRLKLLVLEISKEREELRSRLATPAASPQPGDSTAGDFVGPAGPATVAMALGVEVQPTEPSPLRLKME